MDSGKAVAAGRPGAQAGGNLDVQRRRRQEACPGAAGLAGAQAVRRDLLAVSDTFPDGRLLDYPADWGTTNVQRLEALELPIKSVPAGSEGALVAEIKAAEEKKQPLLVMFWSPHWVHAEVKLNAVELPPYYGRLLRRCGRRRQPRLTYDCDWARGHINKIGWVGLQDKWPAALPSWQATSWPTSIRSDDGGDRRSGRRP